MNLDRETFDEDILAVQSAQDRLSALTIGERVGQCAKFGPVYARVSGYFGEQREGVMYGGPQVTRVARMFLDITQSEKISGFKTVEYARMLAEVRLKIKSLRVFRRKMAKKCSQPKAHSKDCCCALRDASVASLAARNAHLELSSDPVKAPSITSSLQGLKAEEVRLRKELQI